MNDSHWRDRAACRNTASPLFFPTGYSADYERQIEKAREVCLQCPVMIDCLESAMAMEGGRSYLYRHGIYGSLTPRERGSLYQRRKRAKERARERVAAQTLETAA